MRILTTQYLDKVSTAREREVLQLISQEYTTKEIANQLYVSTHTIDSHRKSLMEKWAVRNTAGLVRVGFETGVLSLQRYPIDRKDNRMML